jgi:hypothetical protein
MRMITLMTWALLGVAGQAPESAVDRSFLSLSEKQARQTINGMRVNGQVGGSWDPRVTSTDRSYNYKLRATWLTPAVVGAAARLLQLTKGLGEGQALALVKEVRVVPAYLLLVELDPREGSGVIPRDWTARFGPSRAEDRQVVGQVVPDEGTWRRLASAFPRDYSYDIFLLKFPAQVEGGHPLFESADTEAELVVRIYNKSGRVRWQTPADTRK